MKFTFMLADSAQAIGGKLFLMGGGWSVTGPQPTPSALAGIMQVAWDEANQNHTVAFELLNADGQPFMVPTPMGLQAFKVEMKFQVGRPAGVTPGIELNVPIAINLGPLPLEPDKRYEWRVAIDGQRVDDLRLAFSTRPAGGPGVLGAPPA